LHNNYYFLRHLSRSLETILIPSVISECFSQNKQELIIRFETSSSPFFIKASLQADYSCLSFPDNFHRAKKNSIDLFGTLIGQRVEKVRQFENERSFALGLTNNLTLLFKMHGNRANIAVLENKTVTDLFRNNLAADQNINIDALDRTVDWSYENFKNHQEDLPKIYFTFGKVVWHYLNERGFENASIDQKWNMLITTRQELDKANFFITEIQQTPVLSLLETGEMIKSHHNPVKAINDFYHTYTQIFAFAKEQHAALSTLQAILQSSRNYHKKNLAKLNDLERDTNYKVWADVLMANLHHIKMGAEKVILPNFYNQDQPLEIKLKKDLNAQKNAETFYRKSKNQKIETEHLKKSTLQKEKEIAHTEAQLESVRKLQDLKTLRQWKIENGLDRALSKDVVSLPYHEFFFNGYKIWVGRNAQSNDILTLKYGYKEDLWLHAKDVPGSHVLIKHQAGKNFPKDVIERAAQLAAYNSKRKNETLCPVVVTSKKFVRKRKGDPAGAVIVEKEDVIMVEPKLQ
jgi:predicted ribosome quality control (RQC) complex YloA/Tae2 family protein